MRELKSDNYNPGLQGWRISADGNAEFQSGIFRGEIIASGGIIGGWTIGSNKLYGSGINRIEMKSNVIECFQDDYSRLAILPYGITFKDETGQTIGDIYGTSGPGYKVIYFTNQVYILSNLTAMGNLVVSGYGWFTGDLLVSGYGWFTGDIFCNKLIETGCPIEIDKKEAIEDLRKIKGEEKFIPSSASKQLKTNKYGRMKYESFPAYTLLPTDKYKESLEEQLKREKSEERKQEIKEKIKELPKFAIDKDALSSMIIFALQDIDERLQKLEYGKGSK